MFTGIIEELGRIKNKKSTSRGCILSVESDFVYDKVKSADSVSVNGVCLTVTVKKDRCLNFDVMQETLVKTNLNFIKPNDYVNLECALRAQDTLSGHFVTGHIDTTVKIKEISDDKSYVELILDDKFKPFVVEKGSVALDGISLTVGKITQSGFIVYLIPFSIEHTNLKYRKKNDFLNLECDILAKYVNNALQNKNKSAITKSFLEDHGFI